MSRKRKELPILENIEITDVAAEGNALAKVDGMVVEKKEKLRRGAHCTIMPSQQRACRATMLSFWRVWWLQMAAFAI